MADITSSYNRGCKDNLSGVYEIWLLKYRKIPRSQIVTNGNYLVSFPEAFIYKFYSSNNPAPTEQMQENAGGKFYNQSISLTFPSSETRDMEELSELDFRLLFKDRNGFYRIFGLYNGVQAGKIDYNTGSNKGDLNGFKIDFTGQEEQHAFFIENLNDAGFVDLGDTEPFYLVYQNGDAIHLQNNDFLIQQNG